MRKKLARVGANTTARFIVAFAATTLFAATAVQAAPEKGNQGGGRGQSEKSDKADKSDRDRGASKGNGKFSSGDRVAVREYFAKAASCPPGLDKKDNGCMPPGQAKKVWVIGSALPPTVQFELVPAELVVRLTLPPPGYHYVRVAGDILMMAEGTRMIMDAVTDLGR